MANKQPETAARTARIGLIICAVMLLLSGGLLSTPGNDWLWYMISAVGTFPAIKIGSPRHRKIGTILLTLCVVLTITDLISGYYFRIQRREKRARIQAAQRAATNNIPAAK